jgi:hypothetical protein
MISVSLTVIDARIKAARIAVEFPSRFRFDEQYALKRCFLDNHGVPFLLMK